MTNEKLQQLTLSINQSTSEDVVSVGYGFKTVNGKLTNEKSLVYMVNQKKDLSEIPESEIIPSEVKHEGETFTTDVIEGIVKPQGYGMCDASFYTWQTVNPTNQDEHRPLIGGCSVTNWGSLSTYVGTLGFIAVDNETDTLVGVSNNHVLVNDAWINNERDPQSVWTNVLKDAVTQPNELSIGKTGLGYQIGQVRRYKPLNTPTNYVDCALTTISDWGLIDPAVSWRQHNINSMNTVPRFATTLELDEFLLQDQREYFSAGRTTGGKGEGVVKLLREQTAVSINIEYKKQGVGTTTKMNDTFVLMASGSTTPIGDTCYYPSNAGDSGSAILTYNEPSNEWLIVGLLYGGTYVGEGDNQKAVRSLCNRIDRIVQALDIRAWDGTFNGLQQLQGGEIVHVLPGLSNQESFVVAGQRFWQVGIGNSHDFPVTNVGGEQ